MAYDRLPLAAMLLIMSATHCAAEAATVDRFELRTTADYVDICTTPESDPTYQAAMAFCYGVAVGAYQYYSALASQSADYRYVCLPTPPPSRASALADFVGWVKNHQQYLPDRPVDTIFRYLQTRYPCGK